MRKRNRSRQALTLMMAAIAASTAAASVLPSVAMAETIVGQGKTATSGSLTIIRKNTDKEPVQGAQFSIYKIMEVTPGVNVGEWAESAFTTDFAQFMSDNGVEADDLGNYSAAQVEGLVDKLAQFVGYGNGSITATATGTTDAAGQAAFTNLGLGWYLVVESDPLESYGEGRSVEFAVRPFIVSIPSTGVNGQSNYGADGSTYVDGEEGDYYNATRDTGDEFAGTAWIYDVTATPKATTLTIDKNITNAQAAKDADYQGVWSTDNAYIVTGNVYKDKADTVAYGDIVEYTVETRVPEYSDAFFTNVNKGTTTADVPVNDTNADGKAAFIITDKLSKGLTVLQPTSTTSQKTETIQAAASEVILSRKLNSSLSVENTTDRNSYSDGTFVDEKTKAYVKVYVRSDEPGADGEYTWTELLNPEDTPSADLAGVTDSQLFTINVLSPAEQASDGHGANLTVRFTDHFLQSDAYRGKQIKVVYYAQVTQDAAMGVGGNTNDVVLTYSDTPDTHMWMSPVESETANHDPQDNPDGDTPVGPEEGDGEPDAYVYSYGIQIDKFTTELDSGTGSAATGLAGAKFKLYANVDLTTETVGSAVNAGVDTTVYGDAADPDAVGYTAADAELGSAVFVTDENGSIAIPLLDAGTYYLKEVQAPEGYSLLQNPIKIEIVPTENAADGHITSGAWTLYVDGEPVDTATGDNVTQIHQDEGQAIIAVENHRGFTLPTTGGTGIVVTVAVAVGGILILNFCMLRKNNDKEAKA